MGSFWDFCAPFYDLAQKTNRRTFGDMLKILHRLVPDGAKVIEIAAGTGEISVAISEKASSILCTDISEKMLSIAKKKAGRRGIKNINFDKINIFDTGKQDSSFDIVIASQVFHLIDCPEIAAAELRRIAKHMVIIPITFTKNLHGTAKLKIRIWELFGFSPKVEFEAADYANFISNIGFQSCEMIQVEGKMPMAVAVWRKPTIM